MRRSLRRLLADDRAAVAPTVALSLIGLVAVGGVAFDYARLASMDTELQNAADQAALAAASQLDGQANACARASAAAVSMLANKSNFANDTNTRAITVTSEPDCDATGNIRFYQSYDAATDTPGAAATTVAAARVVIVRVDPREAFYALTPITAALASRRSGNIYAEAVATLGTAICKVPPLMMCNPNEAADADFTIGNYVGKGIRLVQGGNGGWAPGNFGFLDHAGGSNGDPGLREDIGWATPPGECEPANGVDTKPGVNAVDDAVNTRFDMYDGNQNCINGGSCPASINSVKDLVRAADASGPKACALDKEGWHEAASNRYEPTSGSTPLDTSITPTAMGHPRDMCHAVSADGVCGGVTVKNRIGDGAWDRDAYFRVNYRRASGSPAYWVGGDSSVASSWQKNTGLPANATRYQVYKWEIAHRGEVIDGVTVLGPRIAAGSGASAETSYGAAICSAGQGYGSGFVPTANGIDRRKFTVAVANCSTADHGGQVNGNSTGVTVKKWVDMFLVEPSMDRASGRTSKKEVYVEVIGDNSSGGGASAIRRDVPYLIK